MKRWSGYVMGAVVIALGAAPLMAAEHGGQEHGGATTAVPVAAVEPSADQIRDTIRQYVEDVIQDEGAFYLDDDITGQTRELALEQVHERVGKTGDYYYSCTDMKDAQTGELLDLDFDVEAYDGELEVVDVRIHKVNGEPRYTYDDQSNRIPASDDAS